MAIYFMITPDSLLYKENLTGHFNFCNVSKIYEKSHAKAIGKAGIINLMNGVAY